MRDTWFSTATYLRRADFYQHGNPEDPLLNYFWEEQLAALDKGLAALPILGQRLQIPTDNFTFEGNLPRGLDLQRHEVPDNHPRQRLRRRCAGRPLPPLRHPRARPWLERSKVRCEQKPRIHPGLGARRDTRHRLPAHQPIIRRRPYATAPWATSSVATSPHAIPASPPSSSTVTSGMPPRAKLLRCVAQGSLSFAGFRHATAFNDAIREPRYAYQHPVER